MIHIISFVFDGWQEAFHGKITDTTFEPHFLRVNVCLTGPSACYVWLNYVSPTSGHAFSSTGLRRSIILP